MHPSESQKRHDALIHSNYSVQPENVRFFDLGIYEVLEHFSLQLAELNNDAKNKKDHAVFRCDSLGDIFTVNVPKSVERSAYDNQGKTVKVNVPRSVQDFVHVAATALLLRIDRMYTELEKTPEDVRNASPGKRKVWEALNRYLKKREPGSESKEMNGINAEGSLAEVMMHETDAFIEVQWTLPATKAGQIEMLDPTVGNQLIKAGLKKGDTFVCALKTTHGQSTAMSNIQRKK